MLTLNLWAVLVAGVAGLFEGALWNCPLGFGKVRAALLGTQGAANPPPRVMLGKLLLELARCLVVAFVLGHFIVQLGITDWVAAVQLGLWVWVGFQAILILGAVVWERMPLQLYAIHAGDALVKTLGMAVIVGVWR